MNSQQPLPLQKVTKTLFAKKFSFKNSEPTLKEIRKFHKNYLLEQNQRLLKWADKGRHVHVAAQLSDHWKELLKIEKSSLRFLIVNDGIIPAIVEKLWEELESQTDSAKTIGIPSKQEQKLRKEELKEDEVEYNQYINSQFTQDKYYECANWIHQSKQTE